MVALSTDWPLSPGVPNRSKPGAARDRDIVLENFAAELTEAAYPVALRYGIVGSSIDLELELWRVLVETIKQSRLSSLKKGEQDVAIRHA